WRARVRVTPQDGRAACAGTAAASATAAAAVEQMSVVVAMRPPSEGVQTAPSRAAHVRLTTARNRPAKALQPAQMPEFTILGPPAVLAENGEPLVLGGQKQRAVLAVLLLRSPEVVSTEFLIDAVWGEQPPRTATTSLQNAISALRKLIGQELLLTRTPGYV